MKNITLDIKTFEEYKEFVSAMDEDLNTSKALAVLFDLAGKANKDVPSEYFISPLRWLLT